jgi:alkaline phosphatase D
MAPSHFETSELTHALAVGRVTPSSARVWLRAEDARELELLLYDRESGELCGRGRVAAEHADRDFTASFELPDVLTEGPAAGGGGLASGRGYRLELRQPGAENLLASARFETAPATPGETPARFSFAVMSCHQPFDEEGNLVPLSLRMLRAAQKALRQHDVKFALHMGDQIYADAPGCCSLFDPDFFASIAPAGRKALLECTRHELRAVYHRRYHAFWGIREYQLLQAECATYPIMDDHELVDNFGSDPRHAEPAWNQLRLGALDAFFDYQASRVLPSETFHATPREFHYSFRYGACAVFVMDLRSQRYPRADEIEVYSTEQLQALTSFLTENADAALVALVISVPMLYVDSWVANTAATLIGQASDAGDRWTLSQCARARERLLDAIRRHQRQHPAQRMLLLGGDIHVGCAFRLDWADGVPSLHQFTSSALSNYTGRVMSWLAERVPYAATTLKSGDGASGNVTLLEGTDGHDKNPFGGLNFGIVDVNLESGRAELEFKLVSVRDDSEEPDIVFASGRV